MKRILLTLVTVVILTLGLFAQSPEGFKYQAVVRDASSNPMTDKAVGMQLTIQQGAIGGTAVYTETFAPTTNAYGLVNLEIGTGTSTDDFSAIDWSNGPYFIETAVDVTGGTSYAVMGTSQLMSVPYALHANTAENVTNDLVDDADADPANELQDISLTGSDLTLSSGSTIDLSVIDTDTDTQLDETAVDAFVSNNGYITSPDDADADPANELQDISLTGSDLTLSSGSTIDLSVIDTDTDTQLDETAVDAFVSNNGYITSPDDADADPNNEIQTISRTGTTVTLSNGGGTFEDSVGVYTAGTGINITNNVISASGTCGLSIGDTYQGGIIFYLDASGCHGLISAPTDQSTGIQWWNGSYTDTYASGSGLFDGDGNCYRIRRSQGACASCNAAELCLFLTLGGYSDWYLPSKYELNLMYQNIGQGNALGLGNVGGFADFYYWSSTEGDDDFHAWLQGFGDGGQYNILKNYSYYVRAVRAF